MLRERRLIIQLELRMLNRNQMLVLDLDVYFVLDFGLHRVDCVGGLNVQRDGFGSQAITKSMLAPPPNRMIVLTDLDENLPWHHQIDARLFKHVEPVRQNQAVFQFHPAEFETLIVCGDPFQRLDLHLHGVNCVRLLDIKGDGSHCGHLDDDLHCKGGISLFRWRDLAEPGLQPPLWVPVGEPGFWDFHIFRFMILEIFVFCKMILKNLLVRYRGINNKGVLERPWTIWKVLKVISNTFEVPIYRQMLKSGLSDARKY